jgi:hypothetical protein
MKNRITGKRSKRNFMNVACCQTGYYDQLWLLFLVKEALNKPSLAAVALRDGMRERRRREWCGRAGRSSVFRKEDATP